MFFGVCDETGHRQDLWLPGIVQIPTGHMPLPEDENVALNDYLLSSKKSDGFTSNTAQNSQSWIADSFPAPSSNSSIALEWQLTCAASCAVVMPAASRISLKRRPIFFFVASDRSTTPANHFILGRTNTTSPL